MTKPILHVPTALAQVHKATRALEDPNLTMPPELREQLERMRDVVLSFSAFYLRRERAECRPDQILSLQMLTKLNANLEAFHDS